MKSCRNESDEHNYNLKRFFITRFFYKLETGCFFKDTGAAQVVLKDIKGGWW